MLVDPSLALQAAVGDLLAAHPQIIAHVDPMNIAAGVMRPDEMPAIVFTPGRMNLLGRASGGYVVAEVSMIAHVWAIEDGSSVAQAVAGAAMLALMDAPKVADCSVDDWDRPQLVWMRDPAPERTYSHGVIALRAVLRWRAD